MPTKTFYGKRYHGKKVTKIQRAWRRRRKRRVNLATKIRRLQKKVYKQEDNRWVNTLLTSTSIPTGGVTLDLLEMNGIGAGDAFYQREGNKISLKTFKFKGMLTCADLYNVVRIMIVHITEPKGSLPNITNILENLSPAVVPTWNSPFKKNSNTMFKILYDRTHWLQAHQGFTYYPSRKPININLNFKGLNVHYDGTLAGIPVKNGIYMVAVSDSGVTLHPTLEGKGRLSYTG